VVDQGVEPRQLLIGPSAAAAQQIRRSCELREVVTTILRDLQQAVRQHVFEGFRQLPLRLDECQVLVPYKELEQVLPLEAVQIDIIRPVNAVPYSVDLGEDVLGGCVGEIQLQIEIA